MNPDTIAEGIIEAVVFIAIACVILLGIVLIFIGVMGGLTAIGDKIDRLTEQSRQSNPGVPICGSNRGDCSGSWYDHLLFADMTDELVVAEEQAEWLHRQSLARLDLPNPLDSRLAVQFISNMVVRIFPMSYACLSAGEPAAPRERRGARAKRAGKPKRGVPQIVPPPAFKKPASSLTCHPDSTSWKVGLVVRS